MSELPDFNELKQAISIPRLMAYYDLELRKLNASTMRGPCPFPQHPSGDTGRNSFEVDLAKGRWKCANKECKGRREGRSSGTIIDFVLWYEGLENLKETGLRLQEILEDISNGSEVRDTAAGNGLSSSDSEPQTPIMKARQAAFQLLEALNALDSETNGTLYRLSVEDAARVAHNLGLERKLTNDELVDIKQAVGNLMSEFWYDLMTEAVRSAVTELKPR